MNAEDFLKNKKIRKPTYEGVRLVDNEMNAYRIVELMEQYAENKVNQSTKIPTCVDHPKADNYTSSTGKICCVKCFKILK